MTHLKNIFNIPLSCSFWDTLAEIYLNKYKEAPFELAHTLFLVPNRRSCQSLTAAFLRQQGLKPAILPQIAPIAEVDDDELFFSSFDWAGMTLDKKAVISKEERLFLFARMIASKPNDFGLKQISFAQAINLAIDLAGLIDSACNLELSFDKLQELVPEKYATHWQETLQLLKIITQFWPQILEERQAVDMCEFKRELLYKQAKLWQEEIPERHIIAAGITAGFPVIVNMLRVVSKLPNGEIYFAGIDKNADERYWDAIDESHPQFELKELLRLLNISRYEIADVKIPNNPQKELFISEIMRPAKVSDSWRLLSQNSEIKEALKGISLIETHTQRDEALSVALKMRQIINEPEKTAAFITYDRNLARRVASELTRFDIKIDDSAGLPLNLTPIGIFLRLIVEAAEDCKSEVKFISLLKNPLMLFHLNAAEFRKNVYDFELIMRQKKDKPDEKLNDFIKTIKENINTLHQLLNTPEIDFADILHLHIELAEIFASSDEKEGRALLWRGEDGKCAAQFITKILEHSSALGKISGKDYLALFSELMSLESVRTNYGTHPRLSILGPIEARLCHFDYVILGEINEGVWPKPIQADMWMSRPMKKDFGFSLPEKNVGILAADLCGFLAADNVILTRAERVDGVPMKKSRWLLRIETILKALGDDIETLRDNDFSLLSNYVDKPESYNSITAPAPCPPVDARPKQLSASAVDLLVADPYSVFAKYILKLYPLDELDIPPDQRDYGTLIHGVIEEFNNLYPETMPDNALDKMINLGEKHFEKANIEKELKAFWWPKFINTAIAYIAQDKRENVAKINNEVKGSIEYNFPNGTITFTAKADRIDELKDGTLNIIDYKTGKIPSKKQIMSGHALQLLLEGLIASKGYFENIHTTRLNNLIYWHLGNQIDKKNILVIEPKENDALEKCEDYLLKLINIFNFETTPYHSRPIPKYISKNRDYEHLARIKEWSVQDDEAADD